MRVGIVVALSALTTAAGGAPGGIESVSWMQGCWALASPGRTVEEQWMAPGGRSMLGVGRTVKDGELVEYEFVLIRERDDGLVYIAHPSGQPSAEFVSTTRDGRSVVFENPEHDFPQRIGHRRRGPALVAWVEGTMAGRNRKVEFPYERRTCPGSRGR